MHHTYMYMMNNHSATYIWQTQPYNDALTCSGSHLLSYLQVPSEVSVNDVSPDPLSPYIPRFTCVINWNIVIMQPIIVRHWIIVCDCDVMKDCQSRNDGIRSLKLCAQAKMKCREPALPHAKGTLYD